MGDRSGKALPQTPETYPPTSEYCLKRQLTSQVPTAEIIVFVTVYFIITAA